MSCLQNEPILETIYEELMEELTQTAPFTTLLTEKQIEEICYQRFEDLCQ